MNEKMRMFIICAIFALISSCKNYAISKDSEKNLKGFLDKELMQSDDPNNSLFNPPPILPPSRHDSTPILKAVQAQSGGQKEVKKEDNKEKEEIEKQIKELKDKVEKTNEKTSLGTYLEYEKEIKKIREELEKKLKDKGEEKEKLEKELKDLEDSLKKKKEERKKALEDAKQKFQGLKGQVESTTGETQGDQAKNQGKVGLEAWNKAKELGLTVNSSSGTDTGDMSSEIIENAIKQIDEELKDIGEGTQISENKK
ncbi:hypothetical protein [Borreliella bavariensis]|uniref:hypothetical protein n=1 Tax=Borreliella bavariensis TaxID=664662 RepID=UPI001C0256D8|nr:hypothetical protein [Borreliella bavariensis]